MGRARVPGLEALAYTRKTKGPSTGLNVAYQFYGMIAFRACSQEGNRSSDTLTGSGSTLLTASGLRAMISCKPRRDMRATSPCRLIISGTGAQLGRLDTIGGNDATPGG